jgi:integrase
MPGAAPKPYQIAERKNGSEEKAEISPTGGGDEARQNRLPVRLDLENSTDDSLAGWLDAYFAVEVTTAQSSRAVQRRDLGRFLVFMQREEGSDDRPLWTSRLSRAFLDDLRKQIMPDGSRRFSDRTIARIAAHLKTFAKWIHSLRPFRNGDPTEKLKTVLTGPGLEIERALSESQRRKLLDAADHLPIISGRSRDRRRTKHLEFPDERPRRKGARPWRNRAIVYCLIETGMRRAAICNLDLSELDFEKTSVTVREKGGQTHRYKISKEGAKAILDYLREERETDSDIFPLSAALFLPAGSNANSLGRLTPGVINTVWNETCLWANIKHKTPHAARHAMGRHIMDKTGNVAAVQRQLGHKNAAYSLQYSRITDDELQEVVDER